MRQLRVLDLFCGAGGASVGYAWAGFEVTGVDLAPQPRYPFRFIQADAFTITLEGYDLLHASPGCQAYSTQTANRGRHAALIPAIRQRLRGTELHYVIENVEGARRHLHEPIRLCGSSFGLDLRRHRYFETSWDCPAKSCEHAWQTPRFRSLDQSMVASGKRASVVGVHGHLNYPGEFPIRCAAMGIDWMNNAELVQAIPPVYTAYIGGQFRDEVHRAFH